MTVTFFPFAVERRYTLLAVPFGVTASRTSIEVTGTRLLVRFGPWHVDTPLDNVVAAYSEGPYAFVKTAGPARLTVSDRGLTFATTSRAGVRIDFAEPIPGIDPLGLVRHPNLTLTPRDCAGLIAALDIG